MDIKAITAGRKRRPFNERFWEKVAVKGKDDCWEWQAATNAKGYGRLTSGRGVQLKAHRVAFALSNGGFIAEDVKVLHHCDNPPCCNPMHLYAGTLKDNTRDMIKRGQWSPPPHSYGRSHHNAKFDENTARKIIADTRTLKVIAADYGVSWMTVFRLKHGQTWKQLDRSAL
jgi:hypothetical protein